MNKQNTRDIIYKTLFAIDKTLGRKNPCVVLCYHSISNDTFRFSVNLSAFEEQINELQKSFNSGTVNDLKSNALGKFVITFDDGYKNVLSTKDFLAHQDIKPVLFVLPNTAQPNFLELGQEFERLSTKDIKDLINAGWEIGSHTMTHADLTKLSREELEKEIVESKKELEKELGISIKYISYPKGRYNAQIEELVKKAGYEMAFTMDDGFINEKVNLFRIPRIGVDRSHSLQSFKATIAPSNVVFRKFIKALGISGL